MTIDQAFSSRTLARQFYHEWVDEVKRCVPPHKLLVYKVEHGWDPLCEFLDLPIPSSKSLVPFPRCNVKNDIEFAILKMQLISCCEFLQLPSSHMKNSVIELTNEF